MSQHARFAFDNDFSGDSSGHDRIVMTRAAWEAERAMLESEAYTRGVAAGAGQEAASTAGLLAAALEETCRQIADQTGWLAEQQRLANADAVRIAHALARKLACRIEAEDPFGGIEDAFGALLIDLAQERKVAVALAPSLVAMAEERLARLCRARLAGLDLTILPDPALAPGACRIEWSGGGLIRDPAAIAAALDDLVARTLPSPHAETAP